MPSFFKDLQSQVKRSSSLFSRRDNSSSTAISQPTDGHPPNSAASLDPMGYVSGNGVPSPDSTTPPPSDVESDSGPSVSSATHGTDSVGHRLRPQSSQPMLGTARFSMASTTPGTASNPKFTDPMAPKVTNFGEGAHCTQKLLLLKGRIGEEGSKLMSGTITTSYPNTNAFPAQTWPVVDSRFKVLVMLQPGSNKIRLDYIKKTSQSSLHSQSAQRQIHTSYLNVVNVPKVHVPPVHLVILVAQDSPGTYDALQGEIQREGNGIDTAVRKFRMAALLWQAFIAEQMRRYGFGMRTVRYDEEWTVGTVAGCNALTNEVKVHVVRLNESVEEIRKLDYAQQYKPANQKDKLHIIATEACRKYFQASPDFTHYAAAMYLDTHWDPKENVIRGHAALGSGSGDMRVGIFGSHALHAYPSNLASVVSAFNDATQTDTKFVANDVTRSGTHWEAASIGLAAHLHELGHALGLPHEQTGLMGSEYDRFNRTFCVWEGYRSSTGERGQPIIEEEQETAFHELSILRLSSHPCLMKPGESPIQEDSVQVFALEDHLLVTASSGIAWIEFYDADNDETCKYYDNYMQKRAFQLQFPRNLKPTLPSFLQQSEKLRLKIYSKARGEATVDDYNKLFADSAMRVGPKKLKAFRGHKVGQGSMEGSQPGEIIFNSFIAPSAVLNSITVYHGFAVDGIEFHYEGARSQLLGKRGGKPGGTRFEFNARIGEQLHGFILRAGVWIDAIQIVTTLGRKSWMLGNPKGGSLQLMTPPLGYSVAGLSGSCGAWLDSLQLIISR